jgi:hypothetical protein
LIGHLNNIDKDDDSVFKDVTKKIYEIASNQTYNSPLYARLYNDIIDLFPIFRSYCLDEYENYINMFENIKMINPETDYEGFCSSNLVNLKIRTISKFYSELVKLEILNINHISKLIHLLQTQLIDHGKLNTPDTNPCIEYSENLFILTSNCMSTLKQESCWDEILEKIKYIRNIDKSQFKNISSKVIFKHMDILDLIDKSM